MRMSPWAGIAWNWAVSAGLIGAMSEAGIPRLPTETLPIRSVR